MESWMGEAGQMCGLGGMYEWMERWMGEVGRGGRVGWDPGGGLYE